MSGVGGGASARRYRAAIPTRPGFVLVIAILSAINLVVDACSYAVPHPAFGLT